MPYGRLSQLIRFHLLLILCLGLCLPYARSASAQEAAPREVRVYDVDFAQRVRFPDVCVRAAPLSPTGQIPDRLGATAFRIYEDGERRPVTSVDRQYVGSQIAFVFDSSGSFKTQSSLNKDRTRAADAVEAVDELVQTENWLQRKQNLDQMAVIAPTGGQTLSVAQPWTEKYNAVHNAAYSAKPVNRDTPLYKMLSEALKSMPDAPNYQARAKFLVVLSDGVDNTSAQEGSDVIDSADTLGVKILSILIGPATGQSKTLRRLAEETGGGTRGDWAYTAYKGPASLKPLYSAIKSQAEPYILCYRSKIGNAGPHSLVVGVKVGDKEVRSLAFPVTIPIKPAQVKITDPVSDSEVIREAPSYDTDLDTVEPRGLPVTAEVVWQDGFERNIQHVTYEIDGAAVSTIEGALARFTWDLTPYRESGTHSLRVVVRDELGLESKSEPVNVQVSMIIPAAPAPVVEAASKIPLPGEQPLIYGGLLLALVAVVVSAFAVLRRKPAPAGANPAQIAEMAQDKDPTIVFRPKHGDSGRLASAYLIPLMDDAGTPGEAIPIRAQTVHIGRDQSRAQIIFSHRSVSRLHARLVEESDDVFVLHDEGSSSGTFVNGTRVDQTPRRLKDGDLIEFGRQRVRFQTGKAMQGQPGAGTFERDDTEVVLPSNR